MDVSFNAKNVFQAILGACTHTTKRSDLLARIGNNFLQDTKLDSVELQKGVSEAVAQGVISEEQAGIYFPGVKIEYEP